MACGLIKNKLDSTLPDLVDKILLERSSPFLEKDRSMGILLAGACTKWEVGT